MRRIMGVDKNSDRPNGDMDIVRATIFDCIVVGSGPAGVMCAQTLVEAGKNVLMIDAGKSDVAEDPGWTDNFTSLRKNLGEQETLFLGNKMELLNLNSEKEFGQMTPQRQYVTGDTHSILPVSSSEFALLESFTTGGLGNAWGLGCFTFSEAELLKAKLHPQKITEAYEVVARRIGISYSADDISAYTANGLSSLQPGIEIDDNSKEILRRYQKNKKQINGQAFYAGVPALALLTQPKDGRKPTDYTNMDFYYNFGSAAYRPSVTLKHLKKFSNFVHQRGVVITRFDEQENFVEVSGIEAGASQTIQFKTKNLVLACNVFGTARIALRSLQRFDKKIPVLSNAYSMLSTLQWSRLGKIPSDKKTSTAQLCLFFDEKHDHSYVPMASLYSYSSLMLFRLLKKLPLNFRDSRRILQYLQPAVVIAGIHHPSSSDDGGSAHLCTDGTLVVTYQNAGRNLIDATEKRFARVLRQLGCIPFKKIVPPRGASAHYAGTLPFSDNGALLSLSAEGLLSGTKNVFVADASGFHYLPAKGPTLTIMANAHTVALNVNKHDQ